MARLTRPGTVVALVLLAVLVLLASGARPWVSGTAVDSALGNAQIVAKGTQSLGGLAALALAAGAAALAAATAGRAGRWLAVALLGLVTVGLAVRLASVVIDPGAVLGKVAAQDLGRTGTLATHATLGPWPWVAAAAIGLLAVATTSAVVGARTWRGLGGRYEATSSTATGPRGQRVASDWERLDAGDDPTVRPDASDPRQI